MFRFVMPDSADVPDTKIRTELLQRQTHDYLKSQPIEDICALLDMDLPKICQEFDTRSQNGNQVKESQEIEADQRLEKCRNELFPIFRELGFIDINHPRLKEPDHIVILGGAYNACFNRTICGKKYLTDYVKSFDGLSCYRPIHPIERKSPIFNSSCETEFGALYDSFCIAFGNSSPLYYDDFHGDRHLHRISNIRTAELFSDGRLCRIFAAPSSEPELRRANTPDSMSFFLDNTPIQKGASILAITNNIYCNRQFLQMVLYLLQHDLSIDLDVIGCSSDDELTTVNIYDPAKYMQELIATIRMADLVNAM